MAPGAALLSPRGQVLEGGMPRFFRRLAEGVFDEADLHASVAALEQALDWARDRVQIARQAANLAGALLERHRATRDDADLDRAVALARGAEQAAATPADRDAARVNLARDTLVGEVSRS